MPMLFLTVLSAALNASLAYADGGSSTQIISQRRDALAIDAASCRSKDICELKEFSFIEYKKRITLRNEPPAYALSMTDTRFILATDQVSNIQKYGVVQFIRGCQWQSQWDGTNLTKSLSIVSEHLGQMRVMKYLNWEVDSESRDPVLSSYQGNRLALWRWNANPASTDPDTATYYSSRPPTHPRVYLTGAPGLAFQHPASLENRIASNSSLEFRSCLFKMSDLPTAVVDNAGSNIDQSKALKCFDWNHKYVFNFQTNQMETPTALDPICLSETPEESHEAIRAAGNWQL